MNADSETPLSPSLAKGFVWLEKYVVPVVYGLLAWQRIKLIRISMTEYHRLIAAAQVAPRLTELFYAYLLKQVLLLALLIFVGGTLLFNRPPRELPNKLSQVLVPLLASFFFVLYAGIDYLPETLRVNLLPEAWQFRCSLVAAGLSATGYVVCIWAVFHLRRSFALWVSVRDVVTGGPYRYVRHPIYLGYFLEQAGLVMVYGSIGALFLSVVYAMFQVQRAQMEEEKLSEASREYRLYMQRTGFLLPRWR